MKLNKYFLAGLAVALFALFSCNSKPPTVKDDSLESQAISDVRPEPAEIPECGTYEGDTINVHGKFVLFFGPSKDKPSEEPLSPEILEFETASSSILDSLKGESGLFSTYTSANYIRIYNKSNGKPMIILRNSFSELTGMIISDGLQSPVIKKGFFAEVEFRALIKQYFGQPS